MLTLAYLGLSFFFGVGAMLHHSVTTGLIIWGGAALAVIASGCTILGARSFRAIYKVHSILAGVTLLTLTYQLSTKFSIALSGANVSGLTWCLIGCAVGTFWGFNIQPVNVRPEGNELGPVAENSDASKVCPTLGN